MAAAVVKLVRQVNINDLASVRNMVFPRKEDIHVGAVLINEGIIDEGGEFIVVQITTARATPSGNYRVEKVDRCLTTGDIIYLERVGKGADKRIKHKRRMRFAQIRYSSIWWLKP